VTYSIQKRWHLAVEGLDWYYSKTKPRWLGVVRRFIGWLMDYGQVGDMNSRKSLLWICTLLLCSGWAHGGLEMAHDGLAHGQQVNPTKLPPCPPADNSKKTDNARVEKWHKCYGKFIVQFDAFQKGDAYEGEFLNGKLNGYGIHKSTSGNVYVGAFKNGQYNGVGTLVSADGVKFSGTYSDGRRKGYGIQSYADGSSTAGQWNGHDLINDDADQKNVPTTENENYISTLFAIKPQFDTVGKFSEGLAVVQTSQKKFGGYGFINSKGRIQIEPKFHYATDFKEGFARVVDEDTGLWGFIDKTGKYVISPKFEYLGDFFEGRATFRIGSPENGKYGYLDAKGNIVVPAKFDFAMDFSEGYARVNIGDPSTGDFGLINAAGEFVIKPRSDLWVGRFSSGLAPVRVGARESAKWGFINRSLKIVIEPKFDYVGNFTEGLASVTVNKKIGFIDTKGNLVIEPQFDDVWGGFQENFAAVQVGGREKGKWGFIGKSGKFFINPIFDYVFNFSEGLAAVRLGDSINGKWGYIDKSGKFIVSPRINTYIPRNKSSDDFFDRSFSEKLAASCMPVGSLQKCGFISIDLSRGLSDATSSNFVQSEVTESSIQNPNKLSNCPPIDETKKTDHERTKKWHNCVAMYQFKFDRNFGDQYAGEWRKGLPDGDGIYQYRNGDRFEGQMKNGLRDGNGFQSYAKGGYYTGMWKLDKFDDFGIVTYSNDDYYLGFHRRGERHGKGIYYSIDGKQRSGIWQEGRLIKAETVTLEEAFEFSKRNEKLSNVRKGDINKFRQGSSSEKNSDNGIDLKASISQPDANGAFTINIQTNADTASLKINGEEQGGRADGNYSIKRVARVGQDTQFTITAVDVYGNSDTKTITVTRQAAPATDTAIALKPEAIKRAPARDAVAIIIGIQDYKRVPKAEFANNDAKEFYEYAIRALGIKQEKIKMLVDDEADEVNIVKAFENWLPIQVNKDKTDVYVFYSGHGLPAPDGKSLYFLPHGVDKELLSRTAVGQNEIVAALSASKPKSVTMFIDACYSGQTRGGDVLVANAKPVSLKSDTNAYPPNFTVITASANDQISSSSPELKHGIFSFYLMKGMEGEADANKDGKITIGEMQEYLSDKVSRQAMMQNRKQTTQLVGDAERVLITR